MLYKEFKEKKLSLLGFGMMRLPVNEDKTINQELTNKLVDLAIEHGVNYFDTAIFYHDRTSEKATGIALSRYPRDSYNLATKYHVLTYKEDGKTPAEVFEGQLEKCGVDYFDFYLLHNVSDKTIDDYLSEEIGCIDYFIKQKELGRIKHLGFSCHGSLECLKRFLEIMDGKMEFCQLQINYVDWTMQQGKEKVDLLREHNIPLWIMEPVRGGRIAKFNDEITAKFKALRPDDSIAKWAFRFVQGIDIVGMILSGMSSMEHVEDNLKTFVEYDPLNKDEQALLDEVADFVKDNVPCTGCEYCKPNCPLGIDIPEMIKHYNNMRVAVSKEDLDYINSLDDTLKPSACLSCGACTNACPQNIDVLDIMTKTNKLYEGNK